MTDKTPRLVRSLLVVLFICTFLPNFSVAGEYWQQEVNYRMEVELEGDLRTIVGTISIEYINNSPDTLEFLYLKAFPNAICKDSYTDQKRRRLNDYDLTNLPESESGRLTIDVPDTGAGFAIKEEDNTIIKIRPDKPILPGASAQLHFSFTTILPEPPQMRMGYGYGVTKAAYWFPQVCVYDRELGWVNSQYVGWGEWYGDYGKYEVSITAPENQIVAATGVCINEQKVLPDSLSKILDINNFLKPRSEWPKFEWDKSQKKTWHYVAENVNDFAFTTSGGFCIDVGSAYGKQVVAYALRHNAAKWVDAVSHGEEAIQTFSDLFLPYQWPVIRICDAYGGMEYPMLTNCGYYSSPNRFRMLLYHEIGHQWFMGQIGSNQTDRPFIDEGFTTHAEHNAMEKYLGRMGNMDHFTGWYERRFAPATEDRNVRGFTPLYEMYRLGYQKPMVFSYDQAPEYYPYRVAAYYKGAAIHYALRSVLGDSLYYSAMRQYCRKWLFKHPYENDFTEAMEEATGLNLKEFFRQWYHSTADLDYALAGKDTRTETGSYTHKIKLKRIGEFVSPIDVAVIWEQGDTTLYTIPPEGMEYAKPGCILLPTWKQFRLNEDKYEFTVKARRKIEQVVVDPDQLLLDVNRLNDRTGFFPPTEVRFDNLKCDHIPHNKYAVRWRPDLWYDEPNGLQVGFHSHGSYLGVDSKYSLDARIGTESALPYVSLEISNRFPLLGNGASVGYRFIRSDKRTYGSTETLKIFKKLYSQPDQTTFSIKLSMIDVDGDQNTRLDRFRKKTIEYLPRMNWDGGTTYWMTSELSTKQTFRYGDYTIGSRDIIGDYLQSNEHRSFLRTEQYVRLRLGGDGRHYLNLNLAFITGAGKPPTHFLSHLTRPPEIVSFVSSPLFRNPGTFPVAWQDDFYLDNGGVRGYQDREIYFPELRAGSLDLTPPDLLPYRWLDWLPYIGEFLSALDQSFFIDVATVSFDSYERFYQPWISSDGSLARNDGWTTYVSAGMSLSLPSVWKGQKLRVDFPLYLNKPATGEKEFDFRVSVAWLMPGVGRE